MFAIMALAYFWILGDTSTFDSADMALFQWLYAIIWALSLSTLANFNTNAAYSGLIVVTVYMLITAAFTLMNISLRTYDATKTYLLPILPIRIIFKNTRGIITIIRSIPWRFRDIAAVSLTIFSAAILIFALLQLIQFIEDRQGILIVLVGIYVVVMSAGVIVMLQNFYVAFRKWAIWQYERTKAK